MDQDLPTKAGPGPREAGGMSKEAGMRQLAEP